MSKEAKPVQNSQKLSWEDTYKAIAREQEDWSDWQEVDGAWGEGTLEVYEEG